jgi:8-oxo-dGTP pyrophosphatase MutT (NUDIX family)
MSNQEAPQKPLDGQKRKVIKSQSLGNPLQSEVPFLTLKQADNFGKPYTYAERKGKDSIAFILWDTKKPVKQIGLINEYKPPISKWLTTAFGGSIDKPLPPIDICREEVSEEAGYRVHRDDCVFIGTYFVSTQMNQMCHLYVVLVDDSKFTGRKPQDASEEKAEVTWMNPDEVFATQDWKSITIMAVASMKQLKHK